jgi:Flp pilus assembly protein TadG
MMTLNLNTVSRQRGVAVVETVIITPLLLFLILLTAEVTHAFVDHNTLSKSARNGARYLASSAALGTTGVIVLTAQKVNATRNLVVFGNAAGTGSPILPGLTTGNVQVIDIGNKRIQVTATYPYTGILGDVLPTFGFGADIDLAFDLQATVSMRAL